jgi:hypothetical protein
MTNTEAIKYLVNATYSDDWQGNNDLQTALHLAISALERDTWIPVTEKLPEPKTEVMAAFDDGAVCSLWQNWQNDTLDPFTYSVDDFFGPTHDVTHWKPLPEPPKEET